MFLTKLELEQKGFKSIGENVLISNLASIYNAKNIEIGSNVRIDDFVILSPGISLKIGSYVHIACYSSIIGLGEVVLEDYVGISSRVSIFSSSDDYTGMAMTNPMIPIEYRKVTNGKVLIKKHSIIGTCSVILPNVTIGMGSSIYTQTLIKTDCEELGVYFGIPAKKIGNRLKKFLEYEKKFTADNKRSTV
jgi:galactoside O-acetyltransferase